MSLELLTGFLILLPLLTVEMSVFYIVLCTSLSAREKAYLLDAELETFHCF